MKSEERKVRSVLRIALFSGAMGLVMLFSLGNVDRHAASSKTQASVIAAVTAASSATAQGDEDIPETHMPGHSELTLQCD